PSSHPTFLLHNPHAEPKRVTINVGPIACDIYDTVAGRFVRQGVAGDQAFTLAADQAAVFVLVPTGGTPRRCGSRLLVGNVVIDYRAMSTD
ncbi:MAG: hypothetical protein WCJ18_04130, partial [Planctomycetota bacterium]